MTIDSGIEIAALTAMRNSEFQMPVAEHVHHRHARW